MGGLIRLSPAARIVVRPGPALQFGIDARSCGIISDLDPRSIGPVAAALAATRIPVPVTELVDSLVLAGLSMEATHSILADLRSYRVLIDVPVRAPVVAMLGQNALATATANLLTESGCVVRRPLRGETDKRFLWQLSPDIPLVVADRFTQGRVLAPLVQYRTGHYLPIAIIDGRAHIGPLDVARSGPCPMCLDLYRIDLDPQFNAISAQIPATGSHASVMLALASALAANVVLDLVGMSLAAPGHAPRDYAPGWQLTQALGEAAEESIISPHQRCPLCFAAQHV
ncbi:hypothetical protein QVA66_06565 [Staphylococcus chromogenes]|nr:hypothetical protein [Staphylococcus chromogenes]